MAVAPMESRMQLIESRLINLEVGQKWIVWIVGIILALIVGNFAVTIAMAIHMLTER